MKLPASTPDWAALRADFPILHQLVHRQPLIYLDNGAREDLVQLREAPAREKTLRRGDVICFLPEDFHHIETPAGSVRVTGTVFNVRTDKGELDVAVVEGSVQVRPSEAVAGDEEHTPFEPGTGRRGLLVILPDFGFEECGHVSFFGATDNKTRGFAVYV